MESLQYEIEYVHTVELPGLLQLMPFNSWHQAGFTREGDNWRFELRLNSPTCRFFSAALGRTPRESFLIAREKIIGQIRQWQQRRFASPIAATAPEVFYEVAHPRVLIVEDDVDLAAALQKALEQLGCQTEVALKYEDLHRKIVSSNPDYILLDWQLNSHVTADKVVEKATRLIDAFSDFRQRFVAKKPRVVTHSVLKPEDILMPATSRKYFEHTEHWQKPMSFSEIIQRAGNLMSVGSA